MTWSIYILYPMLHAGWKINIILVIDRLWTGKGCYLVQRTYPLCNNMEKACQLFGVSASAIHHNVSLQEDTVSKNFVSEVFN